MNVMQKNALWLFLAIVGVSFSQGQAFAQTMVIGLRQPGTGNPLCTDKITLNVVDSASTVVMTLSTTSGTFNFMMPPLMPADKRVSLRFQRVVGATNLSVDGVLGKF